MLFAGAGQAIYRLTRPPVLVGNAASPAPTSFEPVLVPSSTMLSFYTAFGHGASLCDATGGARFEPSAKLLSELLLIPFDRLPEAI